MTIGNGADQIDLRYFGRGHTNGDAWIIFPALRVVHAGDIFARKGIPFLDGTNGGSGVEIPDTLTKAAAAFTDIDAIITGHSTVMTVADSKEYAEVQPVTSQRGPRGQESRGGTAGQVTASWTMPEKYKGYDPDPKRLPGNVELLFKELP